VEKRPGPPTASWSTYDSLKDDLAAERHESDGQGRAWLVLEDGEDGSVRCGTPGRWTIAYEAGPLGVVDGGAVYLQISLFWKWSTPQVEHEEMLGYTTVETDAKGVELVPVTLGQQLLEIGVRGRGLQSGERITIVYGAGPRGARADAYAEKNSRFWIGVDGNGDGIREELADSPGVDVLPGPPARLILTLPTTARVGEPLRGCVALLDPVANAGPEFEGTVELDLVEGVEGPDAIELAPEDRARKWFELTVKEPGLFRVAARTTTASGHALEALSNPLLVGPGPRILWADLHGHSAMSDGTGTPEDYFLYARDVARLDVAALTDHDHWGMLFLDTNPDLWEENKAVARAFNDAGTFVTAYGFEWTNWIHGHRHVLYFSEEAPMLSSMDERYDDPDKLWSALRGLDALTVPHHPAGGPVAVNWDFAPDPVLDTCTEITSAHGCSEALDCPKLIYSPVPGTFGRDALDRGYEVGFIGSGDGHDGHPGLTHLGPDYPTGGLTAILAEDLTRAALLDALRARRAYATNGPRILLRAALGSAPMGTEVAAAEVSPEGTLFVQAHGTGPILAAEVIRSGQIIAALPGEGQASFAAAAVVHDLAPGEYVYVRIVQEDGGMAWSSPIFVE
jgi:hypothetical protein